MQYLFQGYKYLISGILIFMSTGIFFFPRSNNSRVAAEFLTGILEAELIELFEKGERKGFSGFIKSGYQAASGKKSEL